MNDIHGLPLDTNEAPAADAFNRALRSYLGYRTDLSEHVKAALQADPRFAPAAALTSRHAAKRFLTPFRRLRLLRRLVLGFLLERFPDGLVADESLFVRRQLTGREKTRMAVGHLGGGFLFLAHGRSSISNGSHA
jgi:hypothetical protein